MERPTRCVLMLDPYEQNIMIHALNELRNDMLDEERPTDAVDDVLLKTITAPQQKKKAKWRDEAR